MGGGALGGNLNPYACRATELGASAYPGIYHSFTY
jgi:hypothetical protein